MLIDVQRLHFERFHNTTQFKVRRISYPPFNSRIVVDIRAGFFGNFKLSKTGFFAVLLECFAKSLADYFAFGRHTWIIANLP